MECELRAFDRRFTGVRRRTAGKPRRQRRPQDLSEKRPPGDGISSMPAGVLSMPPPFVEDRRHSVEA